jgi:hypothetical protein
MTSIKGDDALIFTELKKNKSNQFCNYQKKIKMDHEKTKYRQKVESNAPCSEFDLGENRKERNAINDEPKRNNLQKMIWDIKI